MYKVMLVDDEHSVTDALRRGIDWDALNLTVAAVAKSGRQALELLKTTPCDIVISDISMADMNGLVMTRELVRLNAGVQVILISGYSEFAYAQEAIRYGVLAYVLKPIDYQELRRHLRTAVGRLRAASLKNNFTELISMLYSRNDKQLRDYLSDQGLCADSYYLGASVSPEILFAHQSSVIKIPLGNNSYGYISPLPLYGIGHEHEFQNDCLQGFAYSEKRVVLNDISFVLKQLHYFAYCFFFTPSVHIVSDAGGPDPAAYLQSLETIANTNNLTALLRYFDELSAHASEFRSLETAWKIYNLLAGNDVYGDFIVENTIYSPEQLVYYYDSFAGMLSSFKKRLDCISMIPLDDGRSNSLLLHIVKYIHTHLSDCSLVRAAEDAGIAPSNLSRIFKMKMGKTYTSYITELKIAKAREMIDDDMYSLYEIASQLGFNDYFYFLKTFKRIAGVTPTQYAEKRGSKNTV